MTEETLCKIEDCGNPAKHIGWCVSHYKRYNRYGDPLLGGPSHFKNPEDAFLQRAVIIADNGCLEWSGSSDQKGYGQLRISGKLIKAHRYAWMRKHGKIPSKALVLHQCDNPKCVNVDHLFLGTHKDNVDDMDAKGRRVNSQLKGEKCHAAKITDADVILIRADDRRQVDIAADFGISQAVVSKIKLKQAWAHVK